MLEHAKKLDAPWYDPIGWPHWVRWLAIFPLPIIASTAFVYVYTIVGGLLFFIPTALRGAIVIFMAASIYVFIGAIIAPSFRYLVGIMLAGVVILFVGYLLGITLSGIGTETKNPHWYDILLTVLATIGAITGCIKSMKINRKEEKYYDKKNIVRVHPVIRWALFLPVGIISSVIIIVPESLFSYFFHIDSELISLENYLVMSTIFMSITTVIAPSGKAIIGIFLASIFAIIGILKILVAAFGPWIFSLLFHKYGVNLKGYEPAWYQILQGCAMLLSSSVVSIGAVKASKARMIC
jgi:hypothetical protein